MRRSQKYEEISKFYFDVTWHLGIPVLKRVSFVQCTVNQRFQSTNDSNDQLWDKNIEWPALIFLTML